MDDLLEELGKGFVRGIGYAVAEILFGTICYWVGWPICKLLTFGRHPPSNQIVYLDDYSNRRSGFWCSMVGFVAIILGVLYLSGQFDLA